MDKVGVLVIGHGSRRKDANDVLREIAARVAARGGWHAVRAAFMELDRPTIAEAYADLVAAGCDRIVAHPYFLYPGNHATNDIPAALRAAAEESPGASWVVTEPLGVHDALVDVVAERISAVRSPGR